MNIFTSKGRRRGVVKGAAALAAVAMASVGLTSCAPASNNGGSGEDTLNIYWNAGHTYEEYERVITEFGEEHDIKINWQKFQWPDLTTKLVGDFRSGNVPDLVEEQGNQSIQYGIQGNLLDLNEFIEKDGEAMGFPDDFQDASVVARQYEGATYAIPLHLTANGLLFYNKTMLADAGFDAPPATWDEFLDVAKATTTDDVYGFAVNADFHYGDPWVAQQGVGYPTNLAEDEVMEPKADANKALQFLQDLIFKHKVSTTPVATTDYSGPQKLFSAGRAAMFVSGPWDILPLTEGSGDIDWGIAPPLTGSTQASTLAGGGMMIPAEAKHPELAWELMQKLTDVKVELAVTEATGMTMPRKSWGESPEIANDPQLAAVAAALSVVVSPDNALAASGKQAEVDELYKTAYQEIVIQGKPVAESLDRFRTQARAILG